MSSRRPRQQTPHGSSAISFGTVQPTGKNRPPPLRHSSPRQWLWTRRCRRSTRFPIQSQGLLHGAPDGQGDDRSANDQQLSSQTAPAERGGPPPLIWDTLSLQPALPSASAAYGQPALSILPSVMPTAGAVYGRCCLYM